MTREEVGKLIVECSSKVRYVVRGILRKYPDDVEDVLQDAAVNALLHMNEFRGDSKFSTWFTRIALNRALMVLRSKKSRILDVSLEDCNLEGALFSTRELSPERYAMGKELHEALYDGIDQLSSVMKEELLISLSSGNRQKNAFKARRFRARKELKTYLIQRGFERAA
jgi:RNA polymerase sigma factor (sigma-70 family)